MKTRSVLLMTLILLLLWPAFVAAEDPMPHNAISIDLLQPIDAVVHLCIGEEMRKIPISMQYQRVLSGHLVLLVKAGLSYWWPNPNAPQDSPAAVYYGSDRWFLGFYPVVEVDWHPFHKGLDGFYVGLSGIFIHTETYRDTAAAHGTEIRG